MTYEEMGRKIEELEALAAAQGKELETMRSELDAKEARISSAESAASDALRMLTGAAVQIPNFDGFFKTESGAPADGMTNGTLRFYESGTTRRLYARINGAWRYIDLT